MADELKPCPFCGGKAVYTDNYYGNGTGHCVFCEKCGGGSAIVTGASPEKVLKENVFMMWNRRVNDADSD